MQCVQGNISIGTFYEETNTTCDHLSTYVGRKHTTHREMRNHIAAFCACVYVGVIKRRSWWSRATSFPKINDWNKHNLCWANHSRRIKKGSRQRSWEQNPESRWHSTLILHSFLGCDQNNSIIRNRYLLPQEILSTIVCVPKCEAPRTIKDYRSQYGWNIYAWVLARSLSTIIAYITYPSQYCRARMLLLLETETSHRLFCYILSKNGYDDISVKILGVLYVNATSICEVKGFLSDRFPIEYSVRQGCPPSMIM